MQQQGYSFQPNHSGFYIPSMPQGQRAFIAQPVGQMTRPRWNSQVRQMQGGYPQSVGQVRGPGNNSRPRHPGNVQRRDGPYQAGMGGARGMPNQQMVRPAGPVPQRTSYKLTPNTRNQYPSAQPVIPQQQPEQSQIVMQVCFQNSTFSNLIDSIVKMCSLITYFVLFFRDKSH